MTKKLYNSQPYEKQFHGVVTQVREKEGVWEVALDQTLFFPEEGGQVCDIGTLNGEEVADVQIEQDVLWHRMKGECALKAGQEVTGTIDFARRYDLMQQHTGEHILSGTIYRNFGYANVGFHCSTDIVTVDVGGPLTEEEILRMEKEANEAVQRNAAIVVSYPTTEEQKELTYRSKKEIEGELRIVTIEGIDCCACCAPHVQRTGEVGSIQIVNWENYKGGVRLEIKCGMRAIKDACGKRAVLKQLNKQLSSKTEELPSAVERLLNENMQLKGELARLQEQLLDVKANEIPEQERIILVEEGLEGANHRKFVNLLMTKASLLTAVLVPVGENGFRYIIASDQSDLKALQEQLKLQFEAKGGGKAPMIQGTLYGEQEEILKFLRCCE